MAANLNILETSGKDCILSKSNAFFSQIIIGRYIESDKKIKILTIRALQTKACKKKFSFQKIALQM